MGVTGLTPRSTLGSYWQYLPVLGSVSIHSPQRVVFVPSAFKVASIGAGRRFARQAACCAKSGQTEPT